MVAAIVFVGAPVQAGDRNPASATAAQALVSEMASHKLEAIAAPDPEHSGRYIAALLMPGVQLLVVSAETTASASAQDQIAQRRFREAYSAINTAAVLPGKLFFQDLGCNGLRGTGDDVDVMYEQGAKRTIFDGDWKGQRLSKDAYGERLQKADESYSRMLAVLTQAARDLPSDGS
jgi:hypothetical protein